MTACEVKSSIGAYPGLSETPALGGKTRQEHPGIAL